MKALYSRLSSRINWFLPCLISPSTTKLLFLLSITFSSKISPISQAINQFSKKKLQQGFKFEVWNEGLMDKDWLWTSKNLVDLEQVDFSLVENLPLLWGWSSIFFFKKFLQDLRVRQFEAIFLDFSLVDKRY